MRTAFRAEKLGEVLVDISSSSFFSDRCSIHSCHVAGLRETFFVASDLLEPSFVTALFASDGSFVAVASDSLEPSAFGLAAIFFGKSTSDAEPYPSNSSKSPDLLFSFSASLAAEVSFFFVAAFDFPLVPADLVFPLLAVPVDLPGMAATSLSRRICRLSNHCSRVSFVAVVWVDDGVDSVDEDNDLGRPASAAANWRSSAASDMPVPADFSDLAVPALLVGTVESPGLAASSCRAFAATLRHTSVFCSCIRGRRMAKSCETFVAPRCFSIRVELAATGAVIVGADGPFLFASCKTFVAPRRFSIPVSAGA